jgi:hypothetical protein
MNTTQNKFKNKNEINDFRWPLVEKPGPKLKPTTSKKTSPPPKSPNKTTTKFPNKKTSIVAPVNEEFTYDLDAQAQ